MIRCAALSTLSLASLAAAQTQNVQSRPQTYFGVNTLGAQVTYDTGSYALRLGAGGRTVLYVFGNGVGLDADVLFPVSGSLETPTRFSLGGGLDLNAYASGYFLTCSLDAGCAGFPNLFSLRPHLLAQYEWRLNPKLTLFTEGSLGYAISNVGSVVYPGVRLGLNFR